MHSFSTTYQKKSMKKAELVDAVSDSANITKSAAELAVKSVFDSIATALKNGDSLTLVGFGTFSIAERAAREAHNPKNPGEKIKLPARKVPKFKPSSALKELVDPPKKAAAPAKKAAPAAKAAAPAKKAAPAAPAKKAAPAAPAAKAKKK
jgi:DNA-binding protein HU-beta